MTLMIFNQCYSTIYIFTRLYIFILIYPWYAISILLYRLYITMLCTLLYILSLCPGIYLLYLLMYSYVPLWWYIGTNIYTLYIYLCFHLALAFNAPCLYSSNAALLLYDTHIFAAYRAGSGAFGTCMVYTFYILFALWESVALALNAHEIHQGIYFLYTFLALYMIHCINYIPAFI